MSEKVKVIFVYTNLGIGGIAKSLITVLHMLDYSKFDVTLYIRRDDVLDLIYDVPSEVHTILVSNDIKKRVFDKSIKGRLVKLLYGFLIRHHKHLAKQLFIWYKYPIQRKKEASEINMHRMSWNVAICFSTDEDDPIFVRDNIVSDRKYVFVRQSTRISNRNTKAIRNYNGIIAINPLLVPWIKGFARPKNPILCIENYVNTDQIVLFANQSVPLEYDKIAEDVFVIATCGRLCSTKGYDYVVQISSEIKKRKIKFLWLWIGDGPERENMEKMISDNDLVNEIMITGFQLNPYPFIKACDIYVQPSRAEAFGNTIVEALVLKKPVISTKTAGGNYILSKHDCGVLVNNPIEELPEVILDYATHPQKLVDERKKIELIDWEQDKKRYIKQWEQLLSD